MARTAKAQINHEVLPDDRGFTDELEEPIGTFVNFQNAIYVITEDFGRLTMQVLRPAPGHKSQWGVYVGAFCGALLSLVWMMSVCRMHNDIPPGDTNDRDLIDAQWFLPLVVVLNFGGFFFLILIFLSGYLSCCDGFTPWKTCAWFPSLMLLYGVLHFTIYMGSIGWEYPHACVFQHWKSGSSFTYKNMKSINFTHLGPGEQIEFNDWTVDCENVELCPLKGILGIAKGPCTWGGRELFAMMAHSFPVFAAGLIHLIGGTVSLQAEIIDLIDMQDFFLLLLEDDVILNYWGRDMCDITGCTGKGYMLWWVILAVLFVSSISIAVRAAKKVSEAVLGAEKMEEELLSKDRQPGKLTSIAVGDSQVKWVVIARGSALACVNLPYFGIRMYCSWYYGIIGSTLLMKNFACIILDVIILRYCGNLKPLSKFPSLQKLTELIGIFGGVEDVLNAEVDMEGQEQSSETGDENEHFC